MSLEDQIPALCKEADKSLQGAPEALLGRYTYTSLHDKIIKKWTISEFYTMIHGWGFGELIYEREGTICLATGPMVTLSFFFSRIVTGEKLDF